MVSSLGFQTSSVHGYFSGCKCLPPGVIYQYYLQSSAVVVWLMSKGTLCMSVKGVFPSYSKTNYFEGNNTDFDLQFLNQMHFCLNQLLLNKYAEVRFSEIVRSLFSCY